MCGIVGFQGGFDRRLLRRMSDAVAHRGPDGRGEELLGEDTRCLTGLAHRRLAIIDLTAAGAQPMRSCPDRGGANQAGLTVVFNGEIYNYRELRRELQAEGHDFQSASDTEVLLHLYERDGLAMLNRLNGIFAFAIHDARGVARPSGVEQGALFLARDPLGVKPLYYAEAKKGLLFGSEIKALIEEPTLARDIDFVALHQTLAFLWTPAPRTALREVRKLEPGSAAIVWQGRISRMWSYYRPPDVSRSHRAPARHVADELRKRVQVAVERQLVSDVPVGAFLSGGLDSSAVVAMMRAVQPDARIVCYTIGFQDAGPVEGNPSDLPYARLVAKHLNVDLREISVDPSVIQRLPELVSLLDEPQADPAPLNALLIAEHARADGIPVLLSGAGGDDLFSGYRRHRALVAERYWRWLPVPIRKALRAGSGHLGALSGSGALATGRRRLARMFAYADVEDRRRLASYFLWGSEEMRRGLYSREFAVEVEREDTLAPLLTSLVDLPPGTDALEQMLHLERRHFLADHNLNYTDRTGMAAGVEVRVPLLDLDLVKFAATVPSSLKQRGRVGKAIFKRAMESMLPREVIYRPKSGFAVPLRRWLSNELRGMVTEVLDPATLRRRGLFDPEAVSRLVRADSEGRVDGAYTIYALVCVELWCRRFIDS